MKKTLLLSVVASTMIMAGGDIAPVEPVVETPAVAAVASGWDFGGQGVVYYQTRDTTDIDLFDKDVSSAAVGLQLRAVNKDVVAGIGAGFELSGISHAGLYDDVVTGLVQSAGNGGNNDLSSSAALTQAYLTYGIGNTSIKVGRQQLPKALSPFAFSESWNVFKNTYSAALLVNTDITDTTLVYAFVHGANNIFNLGDFEKVNESDGVHMLTVQNKSFEGLTLTGTYYYGAGQDNNDDTNIFWGDAKFAISDYALGLQGGYIDADVKKGDTNTIAFGAKAGANFGMFDASAAYSYVGDKDMGASVQNIGGVKTPLYTQMILNQGVIARDSQYIKVAAGAKALGGKFGVAYGMRLAADSDVLDDHNPYELDVTYKTKVFSDTTTLFAGYVLTDADDDNVNGGDAQNLIRVWGRYNF
jgi:hypothetical protein